eukprot:5384765-Prymnesium_polylepis.1
MRRRGGSGPERDTQRPCMTHSRDAAPAAAPAHSMPRCSITAPPPLCGVRRVAAARAAAALRAALLV